MSDEKFTWVLFFEEVLEKICTHYSPESLFEVFRKFLNKAGSYADIGMFDPLSFIGCISDGKNLYKDKCKIVKAEMSLNASIPDDLTGIPSFPSSSYIYFDETKKITSKEEKGAVFDVLWDFAKQLNSASVEESLFNKILKLNGIKVGKLSQIMYMCKPNLFFTCDTTMRIFLNYPSEPINYEDFLKIQEICKTHNLTPYELSEKAYLAKGNNEYTTNQKFETKDIKMSEKIPLNQILFGPPGTGKTYATIDKALEILAPELIKFSRKERVEKFNELKANKQIQFITFHQSYSYEEFVEGIRPVIRSKDEDNQDLKYEIYDGIFKCISISAETESLSAQVQSNIDFDKVNVFKMSLGNTLNRSDDEIFESCISQGFISLGYGWDVDFSKADSKDKVKEIYDSKLNSESVFTITAVDRFKNHMKTGDLVLISNGNTGIRAIGQIDGDYFYEEKDDIRYYQHRKIKWLYHGDSIPFDKFSSKNLSQQTIYQLKKEYLKMDFIKNFLTKKTPEKEKDYVLIIDEINRGDISKIFGELITLIEPDKRIGAENELRVSLPYSGEIFGVPKNLYIIGTMNTADRSIALLDIALRRRFDFQEMLPKPDLIGAEDVKGVSIVNGIDLRKLLVALNERIEALRSKDYTIGHSYFMGIDNYDEFRFVFKGKIIPLLEEYFYNDYETIAKVLNQPETTSINDIIQKKDILDNTVYSINYNYSEDAIKRIYE